jgi:hypothetical protein
MGLSFSAMIRIIKEGGLASYGQIAKTLIKTVLSSKFIIITLNSG